MGRIKKNVLKYGKKELNSSVSVFLDLTEPKRNYRNTEIYRNSSVSVVHCQEQYTMLRGTHESFEYEIGSLQIFLFLVR